MKNNMKWVMNFFEKWWVNWWENIFDFKLMIMEQMSFWFGWFVMEVWKCDGIEYLLRFIYFILCGFL